MFKPLTKEDIGRIVELCIADLNKRLKDRDMKVELSEAAKQYCVDNGFEPQFGARPLKRFIQKNVETISARAILENRIPEGGTIHIDIRNGELAVTNEA